MATPILQANPGNFNFTPGFIPPSAGDLAESHIRQQLDLAKLKQLQLDPEFEKQRIELAKQTLGLQRDDSQIRQSLGIRGQNVEMRGQDVTMRGQDQNLPESAARIREADALAGQHKIQSHMMAAQMLQTMFPDKPNIGRDFITNIAETDPELSAAKPILHKMLELPNAVNRIRTGQAKPGDEALVGGESPITLATARAEGAKKRTSTGATPTTTRTGGLLGQGGFMDTLSETNPITAKFPPAALMYPILGGQQERDIVSGVPKVKEFLWNSLFGTPQTRR